MVGEDTESFKKNLWTLFLGQFSIHSKIQWKVQRFPTYPLYTYRHSFLHYQHPTWVMHLLIINEPTHHCHPASIVCIQIHFGAVHSMLGDTCIMTCIPHIRIVSLPPRILCVLPIHPSFQIPGNHWSFYCLHSFAFSRMIYSWNHSVYSLFILASFI